MEPANPLAFADLSNVVFLRRHHAHAAQGDAPACVVDAESRPAPLPPRAPQHRFLAIVAVALLAHGAALAAFLLHRPAPMASIGVEAISVEIVIGSNTLAGQQQTPSLQEADQLTPQSDVEREAVPEQDEKAPEKPVELASAPPEPAPAETRPVETTVEPQVEPEAEPAQAVQPAEQPQQETPVAAIEPDAIETTTQPPEPEVAEKPIEKPAEVKPAPKPAKPEAKSKKAEKGKKAEKPRRAPRQRAQEAATTAPQAVSSSGAGLGRSDARSNYPGLVRAHLVRFKPNLSGTNNSTANVVFALNSHGGVTSVRIARSSGTASLDAAAMAMVQRASPFPAPGPGDSRFFNVPIVFN